MEFLRVVWYEAYSQCFPLKLSAWTAVKRAACLMSGLLLFYFFGLFFYITNLMHIQEDII